MKTGVLESHISQILKFANYKNEGMEVMWCTLHAIRKRFKSFQCS